MPYQPSSVCMTATESVHRNATWTPSSASKMQEHIHYPRPNLPPPLWIPCIVCPSLESPPGLPSWPSPSGQATDTFGRVCLCVSHIAHAPRIQPPPPPTHTSHAGHPHHPAALPGPSGRARAAGTCNPGGEERHRPNDGHSGSSRLWPPGREPTRGEERIPTPRPRPRGHACGCRTQRDTAGQEQRSHKPHTPEVLAQARTPAATQAGSRQEC